MQTSIQKNLNQICFIVFLLVFFVVCLRAFFIPITHDEASTFFFYVQNGIYHPYKAHVYTNNHFLNSLLAHQCYELAGNQPFVLRIPNILSFLLLGAGVFRYFRHLNGVAAKIVLACMFVLTFNLLDFFQMCRGYGISIGCMVLGLSFLQDYFQEKKIFSLGLFSFWWQLALAANLTLIVPLTILLFFVYVFQLLHRRFFSVLNILLQAANLYILYKWIKVAFYYRKSGVLDSGAGHDYWGVSFKSLMKMVYGTDVLWIQVLTVSLMVIAFVFAVRYFQKTHFALNKFFAPQVFYQLVFWMLVLAFFMQHQVLGVNYPEDRTALIFYVFFVFSLTFFAENVPAKITRPASALLLVCSVVYFISAFNLRTFTYYFYHVMPDSFYQYLSTEQQRSNTPVTVGGHVNREMNYTYPNYLHNSPLNLMFVHEQMHMNCDYYYAREYERPYYRHFYDEVLHDEWNRVLLKRKVPIVRKDVPDLARGRKRFVSNNDFFEFLNFGDTALASRNCLEADVDLTFNKVPVPVRATLVLEVFDKSNKSVQYNKMELNWVADDLNRQRRRFRLTSGPLPQGFDHVVVYIWNVRWKEMDITLNQLRISVLNAEGINIVVPENYYKMAPYLTDKPVLEL